MRNPSDATKLRQKRCKGEGMDYVPWIKANEFSSQSISTIATNWKNGRRVHLLSLSEMKVFYTLNFSENVVDIKEQYALDYDKTCEIATKLGYRKPYKIMSTDMLVKLNTAPYTIAVSIKASRKEAEDQRTKEKLEIEELYWADKNIPYVLVFGEDMDRRFVKNVRLCSEIYKQELIEDPIMAVKYLIINRIIDVDMFEELNFRKILEDNIDLVGEFYENIR